MKKLMVATLIVAVTGLVAWQEVTDRKNRKVVTTTPRTEREQRAGERADIGQPNSSVAVSSTQTSTNAYHVGGSLNLSVE